MTSEPTLPPPARGQSSAIQSNLEDLLPGNAHGPRRTLLLRLQQYGEFEHLSDLELAELGEKYLQARVSMPLRRWGQEASNA